MKSIIEMVKLSPPPEFQGPLAALSHTEDVLTNVVNMENFLDRLAAIKAAIDAADKPVHEHARPETIIKFQKIRWNFELMVNERTFFRKISTGVVPLEENFFNIKQGWNGLLETAASSDLQLRYQRRKVKD